MKKKNTQQQHQQPRAKNLYFGGKSYIQALNAKTSESKGIRKDSRMKTKTMVMICADGNGIKCDANIIPDKTRCQWSFCSQLPHEMEVHFFYFIFSSFGRVFFCSTIKWQKTNQIHSATSENKRLLFLSVALFGAIKRECH